LEQEQENIRAVLLWFITHLAESVSVQGDLERVDCPDPKIVLYYAGTTNFIS